MASVKGANITLLDATPATMIDAASNSGNLQVWHDTYEASSLAAGSDISVARLPKGAKVYDVIVHFDNLGSGTTLKVGDSADDDRYIAATATTSAGQMSMSQEGAIAGFGYEQPAETDIILTNAGTATGTIKCAVIYSVE